MNKEKLLLELKLDMIALINDMDWQTIEASTEKLERYFELLKMIPKLPDVENKEIAKQVEEPEEIPHVEYHKEREGISEGKVRLKLGGADLGDTRIFIPEKIVRRLNVEEGDWVRAKAAETRVINGNRKLLYDFEILEKSFGDSESLRRDIRFAQVRYDLGLSDYYILSSEAENTPIKIILNEAKLGNLSIEEGDFIDYAYWVEDILNGRVTWKHKIEENIACSRREEGLPSFDLEDRFLEGVEIRMLGEPHKKGEYTRELEEQGGLVSWYNFEDLAEAMEEDHSDSTIYVLFVDSIRPQEYQELLNRKNQYNFPILFAKEMDTTSLMYWLSEELQLREYEWLN